MPIDLGMHTATRISAFAYWNLREYLGLPNDKIEVIDMVQCTARVDEDVLQKFHCDCIALHPGWAKTVRWSPRGKYSFIIPDCHPTKDEQGNWNVKRYNGSMRMPLNGFFFDGNWLNVDDRPLDEIIQATAKEAERIFKETEYFTCYRGFHGFFNEADIEWQCKMITDPDEIIEEHKEILRNQITAASKVIDSMGQYIQGVCLGGDLGSQNGPLVRPSLYEKLCAPFLKEFCDFIHRNSDLKIFMHCCGSVKKFIPILIDCGVDILNPVQISAADMDPADLKREFGDKITFWGGGCDTQNVLSKGTPEEVRKNVKELVSIFKAGYGYVFNQVHNIMGDVSPENIIAMFDEHINEASIKVSTKLSINELKIYIPLVKNP
jgi:uroporphyrinogen decarboxylase